MDEVGLIVTYICTDGCLKFASVGGVDTRILYGKRVFIGRNRVPGVIAGTNIVADPDVGRNASYVVSLLFPSLAAFRSN